MDHLAARDYRAAGHSRPVMTDSAPLSILIADDEPGIRDLLVRWLGSRGHAVTCADCGLSASRMLEQQRFDLVITDIVMPDGDGFELIPAVRKAQPTARILAISGGGKYIPSSDCLSLARGLGAHAALLKPFNWDQVRTGIVQAMPAFDAHAA
jgi:CheY-like chemotaxis protein